MNEIRSFFDSFKEFVWDIIGYFVPGMYLLVILYSVINQQYLIDIPNLYPQSQTMIIVVLAYVIGYIVYGFSDLKEKWKDKKSYSKSILASVADLPIYGEAKSVLVKKYSKDKDFSIRLSNMSVRETRNLVMSFIPESDQKIYTFMFRSELSRHIGNISIVIGTLGIISAFTTYILPTYDFFKTSTPYVILYFALVTSYLVLREPRNKFYRIAITTPFNIFVAKEKNVK